jgi:cytochrome c biogenesis protein CcmG/thiol:disulfide interchange protein DsbE
MFAQEAMNRFLLPLGIFIVLVVFLWIGLSLNPREVPSPLINKMAPAFRLPQLGENCHLVISK